MSEPQYLSDLPLRQRGRASVDFFAHLSRAAMALRPAIDAQLESAGVTESALPEDLDQRLAYAEPRARQSTAFRVQQLAGEWHSQQHGPVAIEAFEALGPELKQRLHQLDEGATTLEADPAFQAPESWEGIDFHRTRGGWDGHPYMGFVHGEIVHRKMVDAIFPGGIFRQRLRVAGEAPRSTYARILDMGCSTGHYTLALAETYPEAEITGVDLSLRTLEHARRVANERGYGWRLLQRCATETGLPDAHFDLATSYI
ncbi:MAG: methyltransferase domain-containing protein, partial [Pseudomonadota bacterium]